MSASGCPPSSVSLECVARTLPHITATQTAGRSSEKSGRIFREVRAGRMVFVIARIRSAEAASDSANGTAVATRSFAADHMML